MILLVVGLVLFLGIHSTRVVADGFRARQLAALGETRWKLMYTGVSLLGFALIVVGYGQSRGDPVVLFDPPLWSYHATIGLTLPAFWLLAASKVPGNHLKAWIGHPMLAGTKLWAIAHLLSNGRLGDVLLFGGFLLWAIVTFANSRRRDRREGVVYRAGTLGGDVLVLLGGTLAWGVFAHLLHRWLIGIDPMVWLHAH
jgi:uncharacterized membrane protein